MSLYVYIVAGYVVALCVLATYAASLVARERRARRRLGGGGAARDGRRGVPVAGAVEHLDRDS